ncbi:MAG: hypothetical protein WC728_06905 [Elusimicrobiota bacterium]
MNIRILIAAAVLLPPSAWSAQTAEDEEFKSQEMLQEMRSAQRSNLERAMANGVKDAKAAAANVLALADAGRISAKGAAAELAPALKRAAADPEDLNEGLEDLSLSADLLETKAEAFREKADAAELETADLEGESLARRKAAYRVLDRRGDHRLADKYFEEALRKHKRQPPPLDEAQTAALAAAGDIVSEMKSAQSRLQMLLGALDPKGPAAKKASKRLAKLSQDVQLVEMETQLMEFGLKMAKYDEESFESE